MAGGEGTRLHPLSLGMPKPMVPLLGRPVMEHIIGLLKRHGIDEIAVTLSDRGQQVSRSDVGPILTKAQAAGLIRNAGKRECSVTGRSAIAWKAEKEVFHGNKPNHKGNPEGEL